MQWGTFCPKGELGDDSSTFLCHDSSFSNCRKYNKNYEVRITDLTKRNIRVLTTTKKSCQVLLRLSVLKRGTAHPSSKPIFLLFGLYWMACYTCPLQSLHDKTISDPDKTVYSFHKKSKATKLHGMTQGNSCLAFVWPNPPIFKLNSHHNNLFIHIHSILCWYTPGFTDLQILLSISKYASDIPA